MLNYNRGIVENRSKTKYIQRNQNQGSIIQRSQDGYTDALYIPFRQGVNKKGENRGEQIINYKKILERSFKISKSPSQYQKENKCQIYRGCGSQQKNKSKFKVLNETPKRIQTDRKSVGKSNNKSMKNMRMKTEYRDGLQQRSKQASASKQMSHHQVSTKHTEQNSSKIIYISKMQLRKLHQQFKKIQKQHMLLKKSIDFCCNSGKNRVINNSVIKGLKV